MNGQEFDPTNPIESDKRIFLHEIEVYNDIPHWTQTLNRAKIRDGHFGGTELTEAVETAIMNKLRSQADSLNI